VDLSAWPILLFVVVTALAAITMLGMGRLVGPSRKGKVKEMPYEAGMDPIHDTRRRFDFRFHLLAIEFLVLDVELLFLYPWAVASRNEMGIQAAIDARLVESRLLVFGGVVLFFTILILGFVYTWRKGVFQWR
jgi:NADH-quinone oxidoreductase subunit A